MTYKFTDKRYCPGTVIQYGLQNGNPYEFFTFRGNAAAASGRFKSIDSFYGGKFFPGIYRANPVTIHESCGMSTAGKTTITNSGTTGAYLDGHFMCHPTIALRLTVPAWDANLENYSKAKVFAKLNNPDADLAVFLGELNETLHLLRHPFENLIRFFRDIGARAYSRNRRLYRTKNLISLSSNQWLQYRYGILPLISDIQSIIKLINKKIEEILNTLYRLGARVETKTSTSSEIYLTWWNYSFYAQEVKAEAMFSHSAIYFKRILQSGNDIFLRSIGLDLTQLPAAAWELVKYSFVVDWFFRVGDWLQAITPNASIDFQGGFTSQKWEQTRSYTFLRGTAFPGNLPMVCVNSPAFYWVNSTLIRHVGITKPVLPAYNPNFLNITRTLDSLALLWRPLLRKMR